MFNFKSFSNSVAFYFALISATIVALFVFGMNHAQSTNQQQINSATTAGNIWDYTDAQVIAISETDTEDSPYNAETNYNDKVDGLSSVINVSVDIKLQVNLLLRYFGTIHKFKESGILLSDDDGLLVTNNAHATLTNLYKYYNAIFEAAPDLFEYATPSGTTTDAVDQDSTNVAFDRDLKIFHFAGANANNNIFSSDAIKLLLKYSDITEGTTSGTHYLLGSTLDLIKKLWNGKSLASIDATNQASAYVVQEDDFSGIFVVLEQLNADAKDKSSSPLNDGGIAALFKFYFSLDNTSASPAITSALSAITAKLNAYLTYDFTIVDALDGEPTSTGKGSIFVVTEDGNSDLTLSLAEVNDMHNVDLDLWPTSPSNVMIYSLDMFSDYLKILNLPISDNTDAKAAWASLNIHYFLKDQLSDSATPFANKFKITLYYLAEAHRLALAGAFPTDTAGNLLVTDEDLPGIGHFYDYYNALNSIDQNEHGVGNLFTIDDDGVMNILKIAYYLAEDSTQSAALLTLLTSDIITDTAAIAISNLWNGKDETSNILPESYFQTVVDKAVKGVYQVLNALDIGLGSEKTGIDNSYNWVSAETASLFKAILDSGLYFDNSVLLNTFFTKIGFPTITDDLTSDEKTAYYIMVYDYLYGIVGNSGTTGLSLNILGSQLPDLWIETKWTDTTPDNNQNDEINSDSKIITLAESFYTYLAIVLADNNQAATPDSLNSNLISTLKQEAIIALQSSQSKSNTTADEVAPTNDEVAVQAPTSLTLVYIILAILAIIAISGFGYTSYLSGDKSESPERK